MSRFFSIVINILHNIYDREIQYIENTLDTLWVSEINILTIYSISYVLLYSTIQNQLQKNDLMSKLNC